MQITRDDRRAFLRRTGWSVLLFLFLASIGVNVFLFATRNPDAAPVGGGGQHISEQLLPGALAYGEVRRGFPQRVQTTSGTSAVLPVSSYVLDPALLPALDPNLALFRDQGVPTDETHLQSLVEKLEVPLPDGTWGMLPVAERWRSADRSREYVFDSDHRSFTVTVLGSYPPSQEGPADDPATVAIAERFIEDFDVDTSAFLPPFIRDVPGTKESAAKTYVVWPLLFDGLPLLDAATAAPVPAVQVQVGRLSRRALSATFTLLSADSLVRSGYPVASPDTLMESLERGGLLPAQKAKGKNVATYTALESVYVLLPRDREFPTYIVPAIRAAWRQPACPKCGMTEIATFVPAIREPEFSWTPRSSGSGAVK